MLQSHRQAKCPHHHGLQTVGVPWWGRRFRLPNGRGSDFFSILPGRHRCRADPNTLLVAHALFACAPHGSVRVALAAASWLNQPCYPMLCSASCLPVTWPAPSFRGLAAKASILSRVTDSETPARVRIRQTSFPRGRHGVDNGSLEDLRIPGAPTSAVIVLRLLARACSRNELDSMPLAARASAV